MSDFDCWRDAIRFIEFDAFSRHNEFPRCPNNADLITELSNIDRNNSFLIFISHCWIRGHPEASGWTGKPHPDNKDGDKYKLCVDGIKDICRIHAKRMSKCYIWVDYGCMNQDSKNISNELEKYDAIVAVCDCIFTPIVDHGQYSKKKLESITDYKAKLWLEGPQAYLNRAWCRVEMLYAAYIPLEENTDGVKRKTLFDGGLAYHCSLDRRAHFVYSTGDKDRGQPPSILPPLQCNYLNEYHPLKGELSRPLIDRKNIEALLEKLSPIMELHKVEPGYAGDRNQLGEFDGYGTLVSEWGDRYVGEWKAGKKHGFGVLRYASGDLYDGEWEDDKMNGLGTYKFSNGDKYFGGWKDNKKFGEGTRFYASGERHDQCWKDGHLNGSGVMHTPLGVMYCEFKNSKLVGRYKYILNNGMVIENDVSKIYASALNQDQAE